MCSKYFIMDEEIFSQKGVFKELHALHLFGLASKLLKNIESSLLQIWPVFFRVLSSVICMNIYVHLNDKSTMHTMGKIENKEKNITLI